VKKASALLVLLIFIISVGGVNASDSYFRNLADDILYQEFVGSPVDYEIIEAETKRESIRGRYPIDARWIESKRAHLSILFTRSGEELLLSTEKKAYSSVMPEINLERMVKELIEDYYEQRHTKKEELRGIVVNEGFAILNVSFLREDREVFYFHALSPEEAFEIDLPEGHYKIRATTEFQRYGEKELNLRASDFKVYFEGEFYKWILLLDKEIRSYPN